MGQIADFPLARQDLLAKLMEIAVDVKFKLSTGWWIRGVYANKLPRADLVDIRTF